jgi:hypothetical protein
MSTANLNLSRISSVPNGLERVPQGRDVYELGIRLGLITEGYRTPSPRPVFPSDFPDNPVQLGTMLATWTAEAGKLTEYVGVLSGLSKLTAMEERAARARARGRIRREQQQSLLALQDEANAAAQIDGKKAVVVRAKALTKSDLDDMSEEDPDVLEVLERAMLIELLLASAKAALDATKGLYVEAIYKKISLDQSLLRAQLIA